MLPNNALSSVPVKAPYLWPDGVRTSVLKDQERGGMGLQNPAPSLMYQPWYFEVLDRRLLVSSATHLRSVLIEHTSAIVEISGTFDQNMNPCVAFVDQIGAGWLYWYDTAVGAQVLDLLETTIGLGEGFISPRVCLDDKRQSQSATSDIILAYMRNSSLFMRVQRDRFRVEYLLATQINGRLLDIGMNKGNRVQLKIKYEGLQVQQL